MKKFSKLLALILAVTLVIGVTGCSSKDAETEATGGDSTASETSESQVKDTLTVAITADISTLDPADHLEVISSFVTESIYDTLFIPDVDGNPIPQIAESYEFITETQLNIKIKEGIKFHDGSEMHAEDVQASLIRARDSKVVGKYYTSIESIDIVDDYTININLTEAYVPLVIALSHHSAAIMSKAYLDTDPDFTQPIGSGAYKFVSWVSGESIIMERNDDYFDTDNISEFKTVELRVIPEGTSRTIALEAGEVDVVYNLETIDFDRITNTSGLSTFKKDVNGTIYAFFNVEKAPFDNVDVRRAFNYAINKDSVNIVATNGFATVMNGVTASHFMGYNEDVLYEYNPEKAKELFDGAGITSDHVFTLSVYDDTGKRAAEVIQGNLSEIGITVEIDIVEFSKYVEMTSSGDFEMGILGWNQSSDPDRYFSQLLHSDSIDGQNRARYSSEKMDELIDAGRAESDPVKREAIYYEAYTLAATDAPWVPLYTKAITLGSTEDLDLSRAVSSEGSVYFNFIDIK